jgi:S-adenosylmethionine:tRNA ribosyltransferase-isomerase
MIKIDDYEYILPPELIAQEPWVNRDECKLLVVGEDGDIEHKHFFDIVDYLSENDVLVVNRSKVFKARLLGKKDGGGSAEVLLLEKIINNKWKALGKNLKEGQKINFDEKYFGKILKREGSEVLVELNFDENVIEKIGVTPLPPYIKTDKNYSEEYQTVYAKEIGSSAAPTAGLHFTSELKQKLINNGVKWEEIVLHVGLGTFLKVEEKNIVEKKLHSEYFEIDDGTWERLKKYKEEGKRIIAVGTTALRALETGRQKGFTDIFIYPPYQFKVVDSLITNFHLPKTSLLMLISALLGKRNWQTIYKEAIKEKYRFFSFGDAMFVI